MKNSLFQSYSRKHVHFYDTDISFLLEQGLALVNCTIRKPSMVDIGCGDGRIIFALYEKEFLKNFGEIVGVDISEIRIERLTRQMPFVKGIVSDALNVIELPDCTFDFVVCSQLIEHVKDDDMLIFEIRRLLRRGGLAYISSIIKKWYGFYFYFKNGSFRLDPTHVREYSAQREFVSLFTNKGFEVINVETRGVMYPLSDIITRLFFKLGLMEPDIKLYQQHNLLSRFRKVRIPIVGYKSIEVLVRKIG